MNNFYLLAEKTLHFEKNGMATPLDDFVLKKNTMCKLSKTDDKTIKNKQRRGAKFN